MKTLVALRFSVITVALALLAPLAVMMVKAPTGTPQAQAAASQAVVAD